MKGLLVVMLIYALSWITTCGMFKLITMCFSWDYTWRTATGVWLVLILVNSWLKTQKD